MGTMLEGRGGVVGRKVAKQIAANLTDFGAAAGSLTIFRHARSNMPHTQLRRPPKHDPSFVYVPKTQPPTDPPTEYCLNGAYVLVFVWPHASLTVRIKLIRHKCI